MNARGARRPTRALLLEHRSHVKVVAILPGDPIESSRWQMALPGEGDADIAGTKGARSYLGHG